MKKSFSANVEFIKEKYTKWSDYTEVCMAAAYLMAGLN
jgi:hypothetical protein